MLFVDDDDALVMLTRVKLQRAGHVVSGHCDPTLALEAFAADPGAFDVVITDISMGAMSGFELAAKVLAIRGDIPVLLTSGAVSPDDERRAAEAGARAVVLKSSLFRDFAGRLAQLLD